MVLLLCPHLEKKDNIDVMERVARNLGVQGVRCIADDTIKPYLAEDSVIGLLPPEQAQQECDILVSIGGDGTMLRMAQRAIAVDKPVFGINTGRLGFLSAFDEHSIGDITPEAIQNLRLFERLLLDYSLESDPDKHLYAVNDVVVQRDVAANTVEVVIDYGKFTVGRIRADGIIVATPTGSTAYSLSAGGPIVAPGVGAFVITPICAHNLASRSFVLGTKDIVRIAPVERNDNVASISVDGMMVGQIDHADAVIIRAAERYLKLLTSEKRSFYGILNREISEKDS